MAASGTRPEFVPERPRDARSAIGLLALYYPFLGNGDRIHGMYFEIVGEIKHVQTIAVGRQIRDLPRLEKRYGAGRWRKCKGVGTVRVVSGQIRVAEIHWYEAHGIGKRRFKIKRFLD